MGGELGVISCREKGSCREKDPARREGGGKRVIRWVLNEQVRNDHVGLFLADYKRDILGSLVPSPEEEEKGPGFSRSRMRLITVEFHRLRILSIYFRTLVTPILILSITLSVNLS